MMYSIINHKKSKEAILKTDAFIEMKVKRILDDKSRMEDVRPMERLLH
jgi:hypothetical protein